MFEFFANLNFIGLALDCFFSLSRVFIGLALATFIGVSLGLARSLLPRVFKRNWLLKFLFEAPKFPPPIAWIPFVILIFGIGEISAYIIVFLGAFPPIFINAFEGAESVCFVIRDFARSLGLRGWRYLWRVILPAASPQIFTGIRTGISMGWMSVIAAEMISGQSGLGYAIQLNRLNMRYDLMVVDMLFIGLIGFFLFEATVFLEKNIIPWHERSLAGKNNLII